MKKLILILTLLGFVLGPLTPQMHAGDAKSAQHLKWGKKHKKHKKHRKHHKKHRRHRKHHRKHTS